MVLARGKSQGGETLPNIHGVWQNNFDIIKEDGKRNTHISCYFAAAYVNYLNNVADRPSSLEEVYKIRDRFIKEYGEPRTGSTVKVGLERIARYFGKEYKTFPYKSQQRWDALREGRMICNSMLCTDGFLKDRREGEVIRYGSGRAMGGHVINLYRPGKTPYMINTQFNESNPIREMGGRSENRLLHGPTSGFIY